MENFRRSHACFTNTFQCRIDGCCCLAGCIADKVYVICGFDFPDFDNNEFDKALEEYNNRNRRFGGN